MIKKLTNFLKEVRTELKKVSWSDRDELIGSTIVVLVSTALTALFIGVADYLFSGLVKLLIR